MKRNLVNQTQALEILGITRYRFKQLGLQPTSTKKVQFGSIAYLFKRDEIEQLAQTDRIKNLRPNRRKQADIYKEKFERQYTDWKDALPKAAEYMFNLNRYAKYPTCSKKNKEDIYYLKNRLLEILYKENYCTEAYTHYTMLSAKECFNCNGSGFDADWGMECMRCDGTGEYLPERKLEFIVFKFQIGDKTYRWHQPKEYIHYKVELSERNEQINELKVKPLEISKRKFGEAKHLINWILDKEIGGLPF